MMAAMPGAVKQAIEADCRNVGTALAISARALPVVTFNRTIGMGVSVPASGRAVANIAANMRARSAPVAQLQIAPFAYNPAVAEAVAAAGFVETPVKWAKLGRPAAEVPAPATQLAIELVEPQAAGAFADAVLRGFGMPPVLKPWLAALVGRPRWRCYAALRGGEIVAGAALYLGTDHGWLGIAGTVPEARRLGAQGALMARRIGDAAALGKGWVFTETGILAGDNPSLRNMQRAGFSLLHERSNWTLGG
jgi:hypothetical protein